MSKTQLCSVCGTHTAELCPKCAIAEDIDLRQWVVRLLDYRRRVGALNFQLEKVDDCLRVLERIIYHNGNTWS